MFKIDKMWKFMALVFWIPGILLMSLGEMLSINKIWEFGMMYVFAGSPFWGSMLFIDWITRTKQ